MNREEALHYIEIAAENRIKDRCKFVLQDDEYTPIYAVDTVKMDIEYYEQVMKYIKENLK